MSGAGALAAIHHQIMWNRLVAVVEEQAQTLIRTAFSTAVREAGDLSAGVFDVEGRMIAQAVTGTPGHVNSMARSVGHFLARFPAATMADGDVFITNDPWLSTGHLFDFTAVTPIFRRGRMVALFACTAHVVDIGGQGFSADARQVYEEGLCVPPMPLARAGVMNESLLEIVAANVREPVQVKGDFYSLAACNEVGGRRLVAMMDEFALDTLDELAGFILGNSRQAMLDAIRALPAGTYGNRMTIDGYEHPVDIVAALTIGDGGIHVDYHGTSPTSSRGINVPVCYTEAYTAFGVRCLVAPNILNNAGSLAPVTVFAPEGSILNAPRPAAVAARHVVGQMLPDVVFGCLHQALAGGAPAEGSSSLWVMALYGGHGAADEPRPGRAAAPRPTTPFTALGILAGGTGARPAKDGLSATAFPSRVKCVPLEITETMSPIVFWEKEFRCDSGGAGASRGGLGQKLTLANGEGSAFTMTAATCDRVIFPARGREGGLPGGRGRVGLASGTTFEGKTKHTVPGDDRLVLELPGGAGYGDPVTREVRRVAEDVRHGFVSVEAAERDYGVVVAADGVADEPATRRRRRAMRGSDTP
ncbi:MAG: hydantoinase B/oxoprolinase family protein [Candidatus Rokubacteria bacterium]|nr:hydantoinase B/oxoprolinase family protein [Candidatus Rokubacteria bacterium]